jgi:hypothetical protein
VPCKTPTETLSIILHFPVPKWSLGVKGKKIFSDLNINYKILEVAAREVVSFECE